jgi:hypothetical protein
VRPFYYRLSTTTKSSGATMVHNSQSRPLKPPIATFHQSIGRKKVSNERFRRIIEENLLDTDCHKKRLSLHRADDKITEFITDLNDYLDNNPLDKEAWAELGDVYMEYMK